MSQQSENKHFYKMQKSKNLFIVFIPILFFVFACQNSSDKQQRTNPTLVLRPIHERVITVTEVIPVTEIIPVTKAVVDIEPTTPNNEENCGEDMIHFEGQEEPYSIDQCLVTNRQYKECVDMGPCTEPKETKNHNGEAYYGEAIYDNHPVVNVTWEQAQQYCGFKDKRLPSDTEWDRATNDERVNLGQVKEWVDKNNDDTPDHKFVKGSSEWSTESIKSYNKTRHKDFLGFRCAKSK